MRSLEPTPPASGLGCGGVVQEIRDDLAQARWIRLQAHRGIRKGDGKLMSRALHELLAGLHGPVYNVSQNDGLFAQPDLPLGDGRRIKQIIHNADELRHLTLQDLLRADGVLPVVAGHLHDLQRETDRGEWVSKLVSEDRHELVLETVGRAEIISRSALGDLFERE